MGAAEFAELVAEEAWRICRRGTGAGGGGGAADASGDGMAAATAVTDEEGSGQGGAAVPAVVEEAPPTEEQLGQIQAALGLLGGGVDVQVSGTSLFSVPCSGLKD